MAIYAERLLKECLFLAEVWIIEQNTDVRK